MNMEESQPVPDFPVIDTMDEQHSSPSPDLKADRGVTLIPRPSDDPRDPLVRTENMTRYI
jgi:hypothetical protein